MCSQYQEFGRYSAPGGGSWGSWYPLRAHPAVFSGARLSAEMGSSQTLLCKLLLSYGDSICAEGDSLCHTGAGGAGWTAVLTSGHGPVPMASGQLLCKWTCGLHGPICPFPGPATCLCVDAASVPVQGRRPGCPVRAGNSGSSSAQPPPPDSLRGYGGLTPRQPGCLQGPTPGHTDAMPHDQVLGVQARPRH